jgi:hypothetical protein
MYKGYKGIASNRRTLQHAKQFDPNNSIMVYSSLIVTAAFSWLHLVNAVNNGLARTPPMGWVCMEYIITRMKINI